MSTSLCQRIRAEYVWIWFLRPFPHHIGVSKSQNKGKGKDEGSPPNAGPAPKNPVSTGSSGQQGETHYQFTKPPKQWRMALIALSCEGARSAGNITTSPGGGDQGSALTIFRCRSTVANHVLRIAHENPDVRRREPHFTTPAAACVTPELVLIVSFLFAT